MNKYTRFSLSTALASMSALSLAATQYYGYVPNMVDNTLSIYSMNPATGLLTPINSNFKLSSDCYHPMQTEVDPTQNYLYVLCKGSPKGGKVYSYKINSNGTLGSSSNAGLGVNPYQFALTTSGSAKTTYLYVTNYNSNYVSEFSVSGGSFKSLSTIKTGIMPYPIAIDQSGKFLYVGNWGDNSISPYTITSGGKLAVNDNIGKISSYVINPNQLKFNKNIAYLVGSGLIYNYNFDATTGALTPQSYPNTSFGYSPSALVFNQDGSNAFITSTIQSLLTAYNVLQPNGELSPQVQSPAGDTPNYVTFDPTGKYVYVTNGQSNSISIYSIDSAAGDMTAVGSQSTGQQPQDITFESIISSS